jgi:hypothetical protein
MKKFIFLFFLIFSNICYSFTINSSIIKQDIKKEIPKLIKFDYVFKNGTELSIYTQTKSPFLLLKEGKYQDLYLESLQLEKKENIYFKTDMLYFIIKIKF